jgi:hypothetical protein
LASSQRVCQAPGWQDIKPGTKLTDHRRQLVNTMRKKIKAAVLIVGIVLGVMFASTQQSQASYYDNFYSYYQSYINAFNSTGNAYYKYTGYAFYYYYYADLYGDYYSYSVNRNTGQRFDPFGDHSDKHLNSGYYSSYSYCDYYYNLYAYYGDYYFRIYNGVASR